MSLGKTKVYKALFDAQAELKSVQKDGKGPVNNKIVKILSQKVVRMCGN